MKKTFFALQIFSSIFLSVLFLSFTPIKHQPEISSTMLVEKENGKWILQVRAALTAFEYAIETHYGKDAYKTPEEFNALVIRHLSENLSITFNKNEVIELQNGQVKLGHETNAIFELSNVPKKIKKVMVTNSAFKDIHDNQSALIVLKKGFGKSQFILNNKNKHTARLGSTKNNFVLQ